MSTPNNGINGTLGTGLIGHWGFDNKSYLDESGNGNTLIPFRDASFIAVPDKDSIANSAIQANTTNYLYNDTIFDEVSNDYNVSIWFKGNKSESRGVLAAGVLNAHTFIIAANAPLKMRFFANGIWSAYYSINDGWNNVIIGYNYVSVNGVRTTTTQYIGFSVLTRLYLFRYNNAYYINLPIDEIRIYNRNLTLSETTEIYTMGVNYVKCETPIATPSGGYYAQSIYEIELATETNGATIYYTLDGTDPSNISTLYTGKITVDTTLTLKAVAIKENCGNSDTMTETYYLTETKYSTQKYIRLFENTLEMVAEFDTYKSLIFERRLYSAGNFTLTIDYNVTNAKELMVENRLIVLDNNPHKVGIIKGFKYSQNGNNETLIITGYELKGILRQRVTIPDLGESHQRITNKSFETIAKELIKKQCIDSTTMKFDNLQNVTDTNLGTVFSFETRYKNIAEELEKIGRYAEIGYNVYVDFNKKLFLFDIIRSNRLLNPACDLPIFSSDFDNIITQEYTKNSKNSNNYAIVAGQGVGESRTIKNIVLGDEKGLELNVLFVDARDINDDAELENRGYLKLSESAPIKSFDCEISDNILKYETDWDLGDTVKIVSKKFGIVEDNIIEQITEYHESGSERTVQVVFGKAETGLKKYIDNKNDVGID